MTLSGKRLEDLIRDAPVSLEALFELLHEGLGWPSIGDLLPEDVMLEWSPEEFHLDPTKLASLSSVKQIPPLVNDQSSVFSFLTLMVNACPSVPFADWSEKLARKHRAAANAADHPVWDLEDLLFFCQTSGEQDAPHSRDKGRRWKSSYSHGELG